MSYISDYIKKLNAQNEKALSVFLSAGFPDKNNFCELAINALESGADMIEVGFPFSDPLADGPTIQRSSQISLENGTTLRDVFSYVEKIKIKSAKPIILMGYANPALHYGTKQFFADAKNCGADGLIIPDISIDEYDNFYNDKPKELDAVLLTTPVSNQERIKKIDSLSEGFVYCVSVLGTTGTREGFDEKTVDSIKKTRSIVKKNKMLIGFGISNEKSIEQIKDYCDGVIVGSAVIKELLDASAESRLKALNLISRLKKALI